MHIGPSSFESTNKLNSYSRETWARRVLCEVGMLIRNDLVRLRWKRLCL